MESKVTNRAICVLSNPELGIKGYVKFEEIGDKTKITCELNGLKEGKHGFHIHEFGNLSNGCITAGAHYNPFNKTHGGPNNDERHVGDLGNVEADHNGYARFEIIDSMIRLSGQYSVIGRSVIVHEGEDDLGRVSYD